MTIEYWTPDDFVEGDCAAEEIGREKPVHFAHDDMPAETVEQSSETQPRRRGRPPNNTARAKSVQDSLRMAFHGLGGVDGLIRWGRTHPTEFYRLCGRLVPQEIKTALMDVREVTIMHALPPTYLDWHPDANGVLTPPPMVGDLPASHRISTDASNDAKPEG